MKRIIFLLLLGSSFLFAGKASAQARVAYVDTEYILEQMTEYKAAQAQLDDLAAQWKKEIEKMTQELDQLYKQYQAEWVLLPEDQRKKREDEISQKEKALEEYKTTKFGPNGELFKKRQQLIKPIQDKVFDAIQQLAKQSAIDIIFDKAGPVTMLYTNAKYDRSDDVLDILGINANKQDEKR